MINEKKMESHDRVLVIGGGVGGIKTALDLSEAGRKVLLIDKAFSIGGLMTQLDRTFPTNNCDLCTLSPQLSESGRELLIELMTGTHLTELEGEAGRFTVTLATQPRHIDLDKCTACVECHARFPECVRFTPGLDHRAWASRIIIHGLRSAPSAPAARLACRERSPKIIAYIASSMAET